MSIKIYRVSNFETTHERELFDKLGEMLINEYDNQENNHLLIGNLNCYGKEIDAVFIKSDSISVIEFKNYGGIVEFSENGDWTADNQIVKGGAGSRNPYQQVKRNKFALLEVLNLIYPKQNVNLGHISGIVLFHRPIEFDNNCIPPNIHTWFHVTDISHFISKLNQITSKGINYTNEDIYKIPERFNIENFLLYETNLPEIETVEQVHEIAKELNVLQKEIIQDNIEPDILESIKQIGFKICYQMTLPPREAGYQDSRSLNLSSQANQYLSKFNNQIFDHQYQGIGHFKQRENVCLSTSTSSGKSLVFYTSGIELLCRNPKAKVLAIYPLKALGNQQAENWIKSLSEAQLNYKVGRIDGDVKTDFRLDIIKQSSILIMTPDVIHSWLLAKLEERQIKEFIKNLELIIVDEIHSYTGVFGSNSAYLFRRLNHTIHTLKGSLPQYISASATVESPENLLEKITGLRFSVIDSTFDSSPKHNIQLILIDLYDKSAALTKLTELVKFFARNTDYQSITFLDSRKMVEQAASIVNRQMNSTESNEDENPLDEFDSLEEIKIYPYRSGYEKSDSERIQKYLKEGNLKGVISTSALEMGIDIKSLDLGILFGIPNSSTSFYQRIGRIGRHKDGLIIIINDKSVRSSTIFNKPEEIFNIPLAESALYLENERLQYIQTLCFSGINFPSGAESEYDKINTKGDLFETNISFPPSFIERCINERNGIVPQQLRDIKTEVEITPNWTYPIRDLEPQFKVYLQSGRDKWDMGSISYSQLMREAYPYAIYYYAGKPYRVIRIMLRERHVFVKKERFYYTKPITLPTVVFPNLTPGNIYFTRQHGDLKIIECELQISENIIGINELRGNQKIQRNYPIEEDRTSFKLNRFKRNYFTSGILITHPVLSSINVKAELIAQVLYEIFLLKVPFESQDIGYAKNYFRSENQHFKVGDKFIAIFDQTYGSLRLTSRLTESEILRSVLNSAVEYTQNPDYEFNFVEDEKINNETKNAIIVIKECLNLNENPLDFDDTEKVMVIMPNSEGINVNNNKVCKVSSIFFSPRLNTLMYKTTHFEGNAFFTHDIPITEFEPIPERSIMGFYNIETGEFER